jgi:proteasome lid subunit RPN8/RPN11
MTADPSPADERRSGVAGAAGRAAESPHDQDALPSLAPVSLTEKARAVIDCHVQEDTSVECGGVLVGKVSSGAVQVAGAIPARRAVGAATSLTFTHEAWDEVSVLLETEWPGYRMVGWYHSHPGFGIFLSEYDQFIQSNFFSERWQVAYVADPLLRQVGFFGWEKGEIVRHREWAVIVSGSTRPVQEPARPQHFGGEDDVRPEGQRLRRLGAAVLLAVLLVGAGLIGFLLRSVPARQPVVFNAGQVTGDPALAYRQLVSTSRGSLLWQTQFTNTSKGAPRPLVVSDCAPKALIRSDGITGVAPSSQWQGCRVPILRPRETITIAFTGPLYLGKGLSGLLEDDPAIRTAPQIHAHPATPSHTPAMTSPVTR